MIQLLRQATYKHGYLIITAAWLYTISFIFSNYWSYHSSPEKVQSSIEQSLHRQEARFTRVSADTALLYTLIHPGPEIRNPLADDIGLFIYRLNETRQTPSLVYWNTNRMYVDNDDVDGQAANFFVGTSNGDFEMVKTTDTIRGIVYAVIGMIPVRWSYFIENRYLHSDFAGYPGLSLQYEISADPSALPVNDSQGEELFRIKLKEGKLFVAYDGITVFLRVMAIILMLVFLHSVAQEIVLRRNFRTGFLFLTAVVVLLRVITYRFAFPFDFSKLLLFDPSIYASNFLHPSLGDLFVNAVLLFWLVSFYKTHHDHLPWIKKILPGDVYNFGSLALLTFICFLLGSVVISLVKDSKISFDVTNIFSLTVYSVISIIVLCFLVLSFFHFSQILLKPAIQTQVPLYQQLLGVATAGSLCLLLFTAITDTRTYLWILVWLTGYVLLLNFRRRDIGKPLLRSTFFIFWVMIFTMSIASIVIYENRIVEAGQRKSIAEKLALQTDPSGESLLNIAATNFDDAFLISNFHRLAESEYSNKFIKDSLINQNFSGYLNKYDTRIYTFDSLYHPLYNEDSTSYASIKTILLNQAKPTVIPELFSYDNTAEGFSYIYQKDIRDEDGELGYLFVIIKSKRYKSEALYPELFNQVQDVASDLNTNYAYAVYNKGRLINHFNTYSFPSRIDRREVPDFEFSFRKQGNYSELWYNSGNDKQVLVVKRNTWVIEAITLFAYLFCSFLLIILVFHVGNRALQARFKWQEMRKMLRLNIRSQIQATIIFLSVFSFLVIGIATISFFILRFHRGNEERLSKSIQVMANEVNSRMNSLQAFDDVPDNLGVRSELEKTIAEISDLHNVDINYYNTEGTLVISTQPYIYNKHLLSAKMEPRAYQHLRYGFSMRYLQSEQVGSFEYLSIYVPLIDDAGSAYAYLNIPYLNSQSELNQEISSFLATLINLNAFIFLIAGAIAFILTSRITNSFSIIGKKMREMNLGKINEEISWNRNDEIGMLVEEYNKMVKKLEESAQALAKSEREGAWREMARQVAHEIKNPLTPMKLSIQYLQNAIQKGAPNVKELSSNMAVTLIEQIDQLSKIAGDFSQFANIGNARLEKFDITDALSSVVRLYQAHPKAQIEWAKEAGDYAVFSDRVQMNRLFTNLIQNAIEANEEPHRQAHIRIQQQIVDGQILLSVADDSGGIPPRMRENIFKPNFTTKSSGTGLGLAICKGIVEKANGRIWFESVEEKGAVFYIRLPKASN
ncbi:sensor histidine kinase [Sediminibacterium soli]|uniref:sensor histidine kinase n=1 Tax=Sediminibacterium soli TaxID=2698829 RepID=UPI00137A991E|nr:HAMP domain-containing sensor histidine kinase [Sediminibacterium soli]NCI46562.1 HAMP domain-containing histidine kinase [Sediminibacterium soli]